MIDPFGQQVLMNHVMTVYNYGDVITFKICLLIKPIQVYNHFSCICVYIYVCVYIYIYIYIMEIIKFSFLHEEFRTFSVDKKNQLEVTFCILYLSSNSCSTCFGQPCAHHDELTTA